MSKRLTLTPTTPPPPEIDRGVGPKEAKLIHTSREAVLDDAVLRLRLLWEMKQSQPLAHHGGHHGHVPLPKPPPGLEDLLVDAARLSVGNYEQWAKLGNRHIDHIVALMRAVTGTSGPEAPSPAKMELAISGPANTEAESAPFCVQNPFREAVTVIFTHPLFWPRPHPDSHAPPIGEQFVGRVRFVVVRQEADQWVEVPGTNPVPGEPYPIPGQQSVHLQMFLRLERPFDAKGKDYAGDARVISDRRLGGVISIAVEVK